MDVHEHLMLLGGAGMGKSTVTLRVAAAIAGAWLNGGDEGDRTYSVGSPVLPLRVSAGRLAARLERPAVRMLEEAVTAELGPYLTAEFPAHLLEGPVRGVRWLLLVDAVDEIADPERWARLLNVLASWALAPRGPYRLLVTSRPLDGPELSSLGAGRGGQVRAPGVRPCGAGTFRRQLVHRRWGRRSTRSA
ncbi:hypothetical protein [Spongiactinospora sp. 9N601]|uniref:hypothetical protein n=1 Tax=Spongiactinospora sp. 9N601 TaxID=3375149 RepID=UPI0037B6D426